MITLARFWSIVFLTCSMIVTAYAAVDPIEIKPDSCPTGANYLNPANPTGPLVTLASLGITHCYYISASGSDSNAGASESTPWQHAPGMPTCSGICASVKPTGGDGFIFRGGDAWHTSSGNPMSGAWRWSYSGSSPSSPIYLGADLNWFAGSSFERPIVNLDNPLSTSTVSKCSYDDSNSYGISLSDQSHVYLDGFEFLGACSTGNGYGGYIYSGAKVIVENVYIHGWTLSTNASDDTLIGIAGLGKQGNRYLFNVIDGGDSTFGTACTSPSCVATTSSHGATGWGMLDGDDVEYSVIRHVSNGIQAGNISTLIGNLMEYQFNPSFGGRHGNVVETLNEDQGATCRFYSNVTRHTNEGVNWWVSCATFFVFNNVWENSGHVYGRPALDPNGLMLSPPGTKGTSVVTAYIYNNTFQSVSFRAGPVNSNTAGWAPGSKAYFANNHIMDQASIAAFAGCGDGDRCFFLNNGGNVFQTTAAANAKGYTLSDNYAPASKLAATSGAGKNFADQCSVFSSDLALCSGTGGAVIEQNGKGGKIAVYPGSPITTRPSSGGWDAGAYQYR